MKWGPEHSRDAPEEPALVEYDGAWRAGARDGAGVCRYADGSHWVGGWAAGGATARACGSAPTGRSRACGRRASSVEGTEALANGEEYAARPRRARGRAAAARGPRHVLVARRLGLRRRVARRQAQRARRVQGRDDAREVRTTERGTGDGLGSGMRLRPLRSLSRSLSQVRRQVGRGRALRPRPLRVRGGPQLRRRVGGGRVRRRGHAHARRAARGPALVVARRVEGGQTRGLRRAARRARRRARARRVGRRRVRRGVRRRRARGASTARSRRATTGSRCSTR